VKEREGEIIRDYAAKFQMQTNDNRLENWHNMRPIDVAQATRFLPLYCCKPHNDCYLNDTSQQFFAKWREKSSMLTSANFAAH
jgi:hypothetical protein